MHKKIKFLICAVALLLGVLLFSYLNNMGVIFNSDSQHGYNSLYFLKNEIYSWKSYQNGGAYLPFPMVPVLILGAIANLFGFALSSAGVTALLIIFLWASLYLLVKLVLKGDKFFEKYVIFVTSSFIISNEIIRNYLITNNTVIWAELFTVLTIYFFLRYYYEEKIHFLFCSIITASFTLIMFHSLILTIFFIFLYGVGEISQSFLSKKKSKINILLKGGAFVTCLILLNFYFLAGNLSDFFIGGSSILKTYGGNNTQTDSVLGFINENYNNLGYNLILSREAFFSRYPSVLGTASMINYFLILILSISALFFLKDDSRDSDVKKRILALFLVYIASTTLAFGPKDPFGIFNFFWHNLPGFKLFRDFFKFHWIILILLPFFCAYAMIRFLSLEKIRRSINLKILTLAALSIIFLIPFISFIYTAQYIRPIKIPSNYFNINYYLQEKQKDNSVMVMPIISWMQKYTWSNPKYDMVDPFSTYFLYKSVYVNSVLYEENANEKLNKQLVKELSVGDMNFYLSAALRNIHYLIIRDDLLPEYQSAGEKNIEQSNEVLNTKALLATANKDLNLEFLKQFDDLYLFKIKDNVGLPHLYIPSGFLKTSELLNSFSSITQDLGYESRPAFFSTAQNEGKEASLNALGGEISESGMIEYKKINPVKYRVRIHKARGTFPLVFSENFHIGWKIYQSKKTLTEKENLLESGLDDYKILDGNVHDQASKKELSNYIDSGFVTTLGDKKEKRIKHLNWSSGKEKEEYTEKYKIEFISKNYQNTIQNNNLKNGRLWETWLKKPVTTEAEHLAVNGFANSWILDTNKLCDQNTACIKNDDGTYDIETVLEFWPQRLFYTGIFVSGFTIFACAGYLCYRVAKKRKYEKFI